MQNLVNTARDLATQAHAGQLVKGTSLPYTTHLAQVAKLVQSVTDDQNMVAAAWLHDSLEDTDLEYDDLLQATNETVANYVLALTDQAADGNRATRKQAERDRLGNETAEVQTVKLADVVANLSSPGTLKPSFRTLYREEKRLLTAALQQGDQRLREQAERFLREQE